MSYIFLTISLFTLFSWVQKRTKLAVLNPVLLSVITIIFFLKITGISYETYYSGSKFISIFLGPATVALALPLYKNWLVLKERGVILFIGILVGSIVAVSSVYILARLMKLDSEVILSLLPKSITTPIGMEVSRKIGGLPSLTVAVIVITGVLGNMIGPFVLKACRIKDPVAVGAAFGTSSHAIGTSKAIEIGELEGAISGVSISIAGLLTSLIIPLLLLIFKV